MLTAGRKMLHLALCLLLAVTSLEARRSHSHIEPQIYSTSGAVYPIDYNDELTIKNPLVRPDANIIFSFSQTRRDQPPQLDNREERLGKYMYRRRNEDSTTTTTTTSPTPPETTTNVESGSESEESGETVEIMLDPIVTQPQSAEPAYLTNQQPERVPEDVKPEPIHTQPAHQYPEKYEPRHIHPTRQHPEGIPMEAKSEPIRTQPAQYPESVHEDIKSEPVSTDRRHYGRVQTRPIMLPTGTTTKQPLHSFHEFDSDLEVPDSSRIDPAARYPPVDIWQPRTKTTLPSFFTQPTPTIDLKHLVLPQVTEDSPRMQNSSHRRHKSRHGNRDDVLWAVTSSPIVRPTVPAVVSTALPKMGNPPPPVPTLSPWYGDDFRK